MDRFILEKKKERKVLEGSNTFSCYSQIHKSDSRLNPYIAYVRLELKFQHKDSDPKRSENNLEPNVCRFIAPVLTSLVGNVRRSATSPGYGGVTGDTDFVSMTADQTHTRRHQHMSTHISHICMSTSTPK